MSKFSGPETGFPRRHGPFLDLFRASIREDTAEPDAGRPEGSARADVAASVLAIIGDALAGRPARTRPEPDPEPEPPRTTGPQEPAPTDPEPPETTGPEDPAPTPPTTVGPTDPGPVTPDPVTPGPVTPGPVTPGPVTPDPVNPGPADPGPTDPAPGGSEPVWIVPVDDSIAVAGGARTVLDVLTNDKTPLDRSTLTLSVESLPEHGVAYVDAAGDLVVLADQDYAGLDSFTYRATMPDGIGGTGRVELDIAAVDEGAAFQTHPRLVMEANMILNQLPRSEATHVAIRDGSWFDPDIWAGGEVPGDGDVALIVAGVTVDYDGVSDARLTGVRVEGNLDFATDVDTGMMVDTLLTVQGSCLTVGTEDDPVSPDVEAEIVIISDGSMPMMMGRGVVTGGAVSIVGADRTDHAAIQGEILAGDSVLRLKDVAQGWAVGDHLVVGGTSYDPDGSNADNTRFRDEVLEITAIDGAEIRFVNLDTGEDRFRFDHVMPDGYEDELELYVGNLSRNVTIRSENPDIVTDRGHVMLMHDDRQVVKNTALVDLGRSDKNRMVDDPGLNVDGTLGSDGTEMGTNPRGRYPLHFHRNGADVETDPAISEGNAVWGSPGWGIVSHGSHVDILGNVVFDVLGAGIAAEAGNEVGRWSNNLVVKMTGDSDPHPTFDGRERVEKFDMGFNGEGYWIQGAPLVEFTDNIAISTAATALAVFSSVDGNDNRDWQGWTVPVKNLAPAERDLYLAQGFAPDHRVEVHAVTANTMSGLRAYNVEMGIETWNHMRNDDGLGNFHSSGAAHELRTEFTDFKMWGVFGEGIFTQYSTQIDFTDGLIVGDPDDPVAFRPGNNGVGTGAGISGNGPSHDQTFTDLRIDGFEVGLFVPNEGGAVNPDFEFNAAEIRDVTLRNVDMAFNYGALPFFSLADGARSAIVEGLVVEGLSVEGAEPGTAPVARLDHESVGGAGVVRLDASRSFDPDSPANAKAAGGGIAFYGWDFDRDGRLDDWGHDTVHDFGAPGPHAVDLHLWDLRGEISVTRFDIEVAPEPDANLLRDGSFAEGLRGDGRWYGFDNAASGKGWYASEWAIQDGRAVMEGNHFWDGVWQVLHDETARRGEQTLSFDLESRDGDGAWHAVRVTVMGFEGDFRAKVGTTELPLPATQPTEATVLFDAAFNPTDGVERISAPVDFGAGHEFIAVTITAERASPDAGDLVAIDNFVISARAGIHTVPDAGFFTGGEARALDVLANDLHATGRALSLVGVEDVVGGTAMIDADRIVFTAREDFAGAGGFTYEVRDPSGARMREEVALHVDPVDRAGLILLAGFDEGDGRVAQNAAGSNARELTLVTNATWRDGVVGSAVEFDGTDDFIPLEDRVAFEGSGPWGDGMTHERTIAMWVQADAPMDGRQALFHEAWHERNGVSLYLEGGAVLALGRNEYDGWTGDRVESAAGSMAAGAWTHVAFTLDAGAQTMALWLDGDLVDTAHAEAFRRTHREETIGSRMSDRYGGGEHEMAFDGALDELRIYDRALDASEIATLASMTDWIM